MATALCAGALPAVVAATEHAPVKHEIISGSELMTSQERERQRGTKFRSSVRMLQRKHYSTLALASLATLAHLAISFFR